MWEWRIFWLAASFTKSSTDEEEIDVFSLLNKAKPYLEKSRTDVYISLTKDLGLKWRKGRTLEVKLKQNADNAGCELWSKILQESAPFSSNEEENKRVILDKLNALSRQMGRNREIEEAIGVVKQTPSLKYHSVAKERQSSSFRQCAIEQTMLSINDQQYYTVSIEGDSREDIVRVLEGLVEHKGQSRALREVLEEKGGTPRGYPEFVMKLGGVSCEGIDPVPEQPGTCNTQ